MFSGTGTAQPGGRRGWIAGGLGLGALLAATLCGWWWWANWLPAYPAAQVVLPVPNGHTDLVAAGLLCEAAGGAKVLVPPPGGRATGRPSRWKPVLRNQMPLMAFEPEATTGQIRARLARNRPALTRLRHSLSRPYRTPPFVSYEQQFPELGHALELARLLLAEGKLAEREGQPDQAARSYGDCLRLGVNIPRGGMLLQGITGIQIQNLGLSGLGNLASRLEGDWAAQSAREMARLDAGAPRLYETLAGEKEAGTAVRIELMRRLRSWPRIAARVTNGGEDETSPGAGLASLWFSLTPKRRIIDYRAVMDRQITAVCLPFHAAGLPVPKPGDPFNHLLTPVLDAVPGLWAQRDAHWRITMTRLALRAYRTRHGTAPASLAELVPGYLPGVPDNPFAPRALVYRLQGSYPLIYSRGPDGDDDGGRKDLGTGIERGSDGDIVTMRRRSSSQRSAR